MSRFFEAASLLTATLFLGAALASEPVSAARIAYILTDQERARWTMADMRSMGIALEAYRLDHGRYPQAASLEELIPLLEPSYIRKAPMTDAWGNAFRYLPSSDQKMSRIVSAGVDGRFDESGWSREGETPDFEEDAVLRNGKLVKSWPYR